MATPIITKTWNQLGSDYCFTTFNQLGKDITDHLGLTLSGNFTLVKIQAVQPTGTDTQYLWFNTNDQRIYQYRFGGWISKHVAAANGDERRIWVGTETDLKSYDGGDGGDLSTVTEVSGPMWTVDTDFQFKVPLGVGTSLVAYDDKAATVVTVGETGGVERVTLAATDIPEHQHFIANPDFVGISDGTKTPNGTNTMCEAGTESNQFNSYQLRGSNTEASICLSSKIGGGLSHDNMPPYVGVYFIKRTGRVYYFVS